MKERPILFSGPMVRALLAGTKTQTRRAVKGLALEWLLPVGFTPEFVASPENHLCPYGFAGDRLWVRETFFAYGRWETRFSEKKRRDEWHFVDMTIECGLTYGFAEELRFAKMRELAPKGGAAPAWWKRPSIHMPRAASRILLEVTGVRVERLQDISETDCIAEGCPGGHGSIPGYAYSATPHEHYRSIWEGLNGAGSWAASPWVWVVEFRRVQP